MSGRAGRGTGPWVAGLAGGVVAAVLTAALLLTLGRNWVVSERVGGAAGSQISTTQALDIQSLLTKAQPSVVAIQTGQDTVAGIYGGAGTGVIISEDGLVLTNAHVIQGFSSMSVTLFDGSVHRADLVASSPDDDVALVKIRDAKGLTPAELGSSEEARVGDDVIAIGNALNLGGPPSVTEGIISAKGRAIEAPGITLRGLIQTDAAINPGNSGGPLVNAAGQVIGINTAIISTAQSVGFAIPIDAIKPLIEQLKNGDGAVTLDTAFLGVVTSSLDYLSDDVRRQYGITADQGAVITDIVTNSTATDAGLQIGDVITEMDGVTITSPSDVGDVISSHEPGDEMRISFERAGRRREVTVELRSRRDSGD